MKLAWSLLLPARGATLIKYTNSPLSQTVIMDASSRYVGLPEVGLTDRAENPRLHL